jgi:hypothetical protein
MASLIASTQGNGVIARKDSRAIVESKQFPEPGVRCCVSTGVSYQCHLGLPLHASVDHFSGHLRVRIRWVVRYKDLPS